MRPCLTGIGIYPLGALLNHCDQPNAVPTFHERRLIFRAVKSITAGSEITVSYVELAAPRLERRQALAWNYFFDIDAPDVSASFALSYI